jgi:hypothetical protein
MAYAVEVFNECGLIKIDCSKVAIVAVSGDGFNVCGHLLLHTANRGSTYFHSSMWSEIRLQTLHGAIPGICMNQIIGGTYGNPVSEN